MADVKPLERKQGNQVPHFPEVEQELNGLIRGKLGSLCTISWVEAQSRRLTVNLGIKLSRGWLYKYFERNRWSLRKVTNKNKLSEEELTKNLLDFHLRYGKYLLETGISDEHIMNMDESPVCLFSDRLHTIAPTNSSSVTVGRGQGYKERRFATLVIAINAKGDQPAKIHVIFRGKGTRIRENEEKNWPDNVVVHFQANAWMDTPTMLEWIDSMNLAPGTILLMDNLHAHRAVEDELRARGIIPWFLPPKTTDCAQPVDRSVGKWLKVRIHELILKYQDDHNVDIETISPCELRAIFLQVYVR